MPDGDTEQLYADALAWSRQKGWRVGRKWLTDRGATKAEAYQIMDMLDRAGVPPRWPGQDPLLSDEARQYLGDERFSAVQARKAVPDALPVAVAVDDGSGHPAMEVEEPDTLRQIATLVQQHALTGVMDLSKVKTPTLVDSSVKLGRFVSEANVVLGAMLVELEVRFDRQPQALHDLGYANFKGFVQERIAVGYDTAIKLMQIVKVYNRQGGVEMGTLLDTPYTKLYAGINLAKDDPHAALQNARSKTLREIEQLDPFEKADRESPRDQMAYLDTQRYPQSLVELFDAARDRVAAAGRKVGATVNTHSVLEELCLFIIGLEPGILEHDWEGNANLKRVGA